MYRLDLLIFILESFWKGWFRYFIYPFLSFEFPQLFELMEVQKSFLAAADVHASASAGGGEKFQIKKIEIVARIRKLNLVKNQ